MGHDYIFQIMLPLCIPFIMQSNQQGNFFNLFIFCPRYGRFTLPPQSFDVCTISMKYLNIDFLYIIEFIFVCDSYSSSLTQVRWPRYLVGLFSWIPINRLRSLSLTQQLVRIALPHWSLSSLRPPPLSCFIPITLLSVFDTYAM